jgi:Uma2 family endonuclease
MGEILERPKAPMRRRLDIDVYYKMAEVGILTDPRHVELIDGEIIDMAAIGSPHAAVTNRLVRGFARAAAEGLTLMSVQSPLRLDAYNEPQPDLMLLRPRADDYRASHPSATDVLLLVEVSETSLAYDRGIKLALYAKFEVPEVWIIDLSGSAVEIYREPKDGAHVLRERLTDGLLAPALVPGVTIDVTGLLA